MDEPTRLAVFGSIVDARRETHDPRRAGVAARSSIDGVERPRLKVFLSHNSADKPLARRLAHDLQTANVDVWLDQWQIGVGDAFEQCIEQGLAQADFVIVLLTRGSVASEWVNREWRDKIAREAATRRIVVLPVRAENCELPDFLAQRSHADISGGSYLSGFRYLLELLRQHGDNPAIARADAAIEARSRQRLAHLLEIERQLQQQPQPASSLRIMLPVVAPVAVQISHDLIPLVAPDARGESRALDLLTPRLQEVLQARYGFAFPSIAFHGDATDLPAGTAIVLLDEIPECVLHVAPDDVLAYASVSQLSALGIAAERWHDHATGVDRARIAASDRAAATSAGLGCVDATEYLFQALYQVIRRHVAMFLDIDEVQRLVKATEPAAGPMPQSVSWIELTEVLRGLLEEDIGIGDLPAILQALAMSEAQPLDTAARVEKARHALREQITGSFLAGHPNVRVLVLGAATQAHIGRALHHTAAGSYLKLDPECTQALLGAVRRQVDALGTGAAGCALLVKSTQLRPYMRRLVALEFPALHALSLQDLVPGTPLQVLGAVDLPASWVRQA
jgi:hypothetical protein